MPSTSCSFAYPGTYGHECGASALLVGVKVTDLTRDGVYYARRCAKCATIKGGENTGISHFVPFAPAVHVNKWR